MVSKYYHLIKISIFVVEYGIKYLVHGVSLLAIVVVSFVTYMIFDGHSSIKMWKNVDIFSFFKILFVR